MTISLEAWRLEQGLTLKQLQQALGARSHARVSDWAKGRSLPRDPDIIARIVEITDGAVTLEVLYANYAKQRGDAAEQLIRVKVAAE